MPRIVYYVAASLDGYIADADGSVDWLPQGDPEGYGYSDFYSTVSAIVMGRRTYNQVLDFGEWPYAGKPAYVFTSNPPGGGPPEVRFVRSEAADFARTLASRYSGVVWLVGGGGLAGQFQDAGLIDEYRVFVIPVVLGRGVPLCRSAARPAPLRLETTRAYASGVVQLRYRPDRE